jgi:hypothetical protein
MGARRHGQGGSCPLENQKACVNEEPSALPRPQSPWKNSCRRPCMRQVLVNIADFSSVAYLKLISVHLLLGHYYSCECMHVILN